MFSDYDEAYEYYEERLTQEMEEEYYDAYESELILLDDDIKNSDWWDMDIQILKKVIAKTQERLKYMYQDANHVESGDYEETMRGEYDNHMSETEGFKEKYPTYEDWEDSDDYYENVQFIQDVEWKDFQSNYEDELRVFGSWDRIWELTRRISETSDKLADIPNKIIECKEHAMRETIEYNFDGDY